MILRMMLCTIACNEFGINILLLQASGRHCSSQKPWLPSGQSNCQRGQPRGSKVLLAPNIETKKSECQSSTSSSSSGTSNPSSSASTSDEEDVTPWQQQLLSGSLCDVVAALVQRFSAMAPVEVVPQYTEFVQSAMYRRRLLLAMEHLSPPPADWTAQDRVSWLIALNDRKEVDLRGMAPNFSRPLGFRRGHGSMVGSNCFISSMIQLLRGHEEDGADRDTLRLHPFTW